MKAENEVQSSEKKLIYLLIFTYCLVFLWQIFVYSEL